MQIAFNGEITTYLTTYLPTYLPTNKTPVEIIKRGTFGVTYFREIYFGIYGKWYKKSWKEFDVLKNIDKKYYCSNYYDSVLINMVPSVEHH